MRPLLIGLTGRIGTGKSTAAGILAELGAEVISGDELGRKTLEETPELLEQIRKRFGDVVFAPDGTLRRRELGDRVFANRDDASWLTSLTFPSIYSRWREAIRTCRTQVLVFDAALILTWGIESEFDVLLIVEADAHRIRQRLEESGRLSSEEAAARMKVQELPDSTEKTNRVFLRNNGTMIDFETAVREAWRQHIVPRLHERREFGNDPIR